MTLLAAAAEGPLESAEAGWLLYNAWIFPLIPFLSFLGILFFGKRLPKKGAELGIAALGLCFILAVAAGVQWKGHVDGGHSAEAEHSDEALVVAPGESAAGAELAAESGGEPAEGDAVEGEAVEGDHGGEAVAGEEGEHAEEAEHETVAPIQHTWTWFQSGLLEFEVGVFVDGLSVMMLFVVTLISLLVHIYSTDYVAGDIRYTHFFAFLSLFTASMLMLVISQSIVQFITSWELVGVCSFALIGHWWEEPKNSDAALKAFFTNRVGDVGLLVGMIILFFTAGAAKTFSIYDISTAAASGTVSKTALTVAALCLLAAVMSKSGQFFLHTWLPDAMAGPTPVSALIHAATMVVAGVFMVARLYPVFFEGMSISGSSLNALALIGGLTTLVGGSLAFVQNDIKKVLAYSTVSQLGYMVMALGVGAWTAAVFHLFTHAFFKACLFLGSGSVSHAANHSFDMKTDMGGLKKYMPITHATFLIGTGALAGLPILSGFWSKDEILAGTGGFGLTEANGNYSVMLVMGFVTGAMTAAYMTRCYWLTFMGEWRGANSPNAHHGAGHGGGHGGHDDQDAHGHAAHGAGHDDHGHDAAHDDHGALVHASAGHGDDHGGLPHESGRRITTPLIILAVLSFLPVFANIPAKFGFVPEGWRLRFEHYVEPKGEYFPAIKHADFSAPIALISLVLAAGAVLVAASYYKRAQAKDPMATEIRDGLTRNNALAAAGYRVLENKYYLDWLYTDVIVHHTKTTLAFLANWFNKYILDGIVNGSAMVARKLAKFVYEIIDQKGVDGLVNGSGQLSSGTGGVLRRIQTGRISQYASLLFAGAALLAGILVVVI